MKVFGDGYEHQECSETLAEGPKLDFTSGPHCRLGPSLPQVILMIPVGLEPVRASFDTCLENLLRSSRSTQLKLDEAE
jgi:hypothetical protein